MTTSIDSQAVLYSPGNNDELMTPAYAVLPILKYIPKDAIVWCPFDTKESEFVKQISKQNEVIYSHPSMSDVNDYNDYNFYNFEPVEWDVMVSNPPFGKKRFIFERALSFNRPFALIMSLTWLNDAAPKQIYMDANRQMQLLMFDRRIRFNSPDGRPNDKITFSSAYYCADFLPKDIMLERLII